jgi:opacity protein-like surface antigen
MSMPCSFPGSSSRIKTMFGFGLVAAAGVTSAVAAIAEVAAANAVNEYNRLSILQQWYSSHWEVQ